MYAPSCKNHISAVVVILLIVVGQAAGSRYLITNNDNSQGNSATVFSIGQGGVLTQAAVVKTGGAGWDGLGAVVTNKINISHDANGDCAYLSDLLPIGIGGTPAIAAINVATLTLVGDFKSSP